MTSFLMFRKNKNSEKTGARARNTPFGAYCYALTNKEHSRTRSVRIYVLYVMKFWFRFCRVRSHLFLSFLADTRTMNSPNSGENRREKNNIPQNPMILFRPIKATMGHSIR